MAFPVVPAPVASEGGGSGAWRLNHGGDDVTVPGRTQVRERRTAKADIPRAGEREQAWEDD